VEALCLVLAEEVVEVLAVGVEVAILAPGVDGGFELDNWFCLCSP
jgi:hypothetical protein